MDPEGGESGAKAGLIIQHALSIARAPGNKHAVETFDAVQIWLADYFQASTQLDISRYEVSIDTSAIRHIRKEHGNPDSEQRRGQISVNDEDFREIPRIISSPNMVALGTRSKSGRNQIVFLKLFATYWALLFAEVRTGRRHVSIVSMRKYPPAMNADRILATLDPNARSNRGNAIDIIDLERRFNEAPASPDERKPLSS